MSYNLENLFKATDPLTVLVEALEKRLSQHEPLTRVVKIFDSSIDGVINVSQKQQSSMPYLKLEPDGLPATLPKMTNTDAEFQFGISILAMAAADDDASRDFLPLVWAIMTAITSLGTPGKGYYLGLPYVVGLQVQSMPISSPDKTDEEGQGEWATLGRLVFTLRISRSIMQQAAYPTLVMKFSEVVTLRMEDQH